MYCEGASGQSQEDRAPTSMTVDLASSASQWPGTEREEEREEGRAWTERNLGDVIKCNSSA